MSDLKSEVESWHERFQEQARWTETVRGYIVEQLKLDQASNILEVGCGTGAVTSAMEDRLNARIHGLDINLLFLFKASQSHRSVKYIGANAYTIPYRRGAFDACYCHYLLLWLDDPLAALREMQRVVRKGGWVILMAEPDYEKRIDYPPPLVNLGQEQADSLARQGANPNIGRSIAHLMVQTGYQNVVSGLMGGQWSAQPDLTQTDSEWDTLIDDLGGSQSDDQFMAMRKIDMQAWQAGYRILFVPTFYAWGQVY